MDESFSLGSTTFNSRNSWIGYEIELKASCVHESAECPCNLNSEAKRYRVTENQKTFNQLTPNARYEVRVAIVNELGRGPWSNVYPVLTKPTLTLTRENVQIKGQSRSVEVKVNISTCQYNGPFKMLYFKGSRRHDPEVVQMHDPTNNSTIFNHVVNLTENYTPNVNYNIFVRAEMIPKCNHERCAVEYHEMIKIPEACPESPAVFELSDFSYYHHKLTSKSFIITLKPPEMSNGVILNYEAFIWKGCPVNVIECFCQDRFVGKRVIPAANDNQDTEFVFDSLDPYTKYTIDIKAENSVKNCDSSHSKPFTVITRPDLTKSSFDFR